MVVADSADMYMFDGLNGKIIDTSKRSCWYIEAKPSKWEYLAKIQVR